MSFKDFYSYFQFWWPFCSVERNDFSNFGRRLSKDNFYDIILKSLHWSRRRCHFTVVLLLAQAAILFSVAE